jgi:hypothetical protein
MARGATALMARRATALMTPGATASMALRHVAITARPTVAVRNMAAAAATSTAMDLLTVTLVRRRVASPGAEPHHRIPRTSSARSAPRDHAVPQRLEHEQGQPDHDEIHQGGDHEHHVPASGR